MKDGEFGVRQKGSRGGSYPSQATKNWSPTPRLRPRSLQRYLDPLSPVRAHEANSYFLAGGDGDDLIQEGEYRPL